MEKLIEEVETVKSVSFEEGVKNVMISYWENPFNEFIDDIIGVLDMEAIRNRGLRISVRFNAW